MRALIPTPVSNVEFILRQIILGFCSSNTHDSSILSEVLSPAEYLSSSSLALVRLNPTLTYSFTFKPWHVPLPLWSHSFVFLCCQSYHFCCLNIYPFLRSLSSIIALNKSFLSSTPELLALPYTPLCYVLLNLTLIILKIAVFFVFLHFPLVICSTKKTTMFMFFITFILFSYCNKNNQD